MGAFTTLTALAVIVGVTFASIPFGLQNGHEYEFHYVAKAISGIPDLKNQYAGVILDANVVFQKHQDLLLMKVLRMKAVQINGKVPDCPLRELLEEIRRIQGVEVHTTDITEFLAHPVLIKYHQGRIESFEINHEVPEWSVNIIKGILSMIKIKADKFLPQYTNGQGMMEQERVNLYNQEERYYETENFDRVGRYNTRLDKTNLRNIFVNFETMEDGVTGICDTTYNVNSMPWEARPNRNVLNITKIKNLENCVEKPEFIFNTLQQTGCKNCKNTKLHPFTNVDVIEYHCVETQTGVFEFEKIVAEGQMVFAPHTTFGDDFVTNTSRILVLKHKQPISREFVRVQNGKVYQSLKYKFPMHQIVQQKHMYKNNQFDLLMAPPSPYFYGFQEMQRLGVQQIAQQIMQIAREIRTLEQEEKPLILSRVNVLVKHLRMLNFNEIEQLYQEVIRGGQVEHKIVKRVFVDALTMCGTSPCIMHLIKLIEKRELVGEEAVLVLQQIPTTIFTPHHKLIRELIKLARSPVVLEHQQLYTTAWLSIGTIYGIACNGTGLTRYTPSFVPEDFYCPLEVSQRLLSEFAQELNTVQKHWKKLALINALGNTIHPDVVEILLPYISGQKTQCPILRSTAIYALTGTAKIRPMLCLDVLAPIYFNVEEDAQVRIAALSQIVACRTHHNLLEKIAASTWTEKSSQVGSYVYSILKNLAHADHPCLESLKVKAKAALELCNDEFRGNYMDSQSIIFDDKLMEKFNMYNTFQSEWYMGKHAIIPSMLFAKLNRTLAGRNFNLFQVAMQQVGLQKIFNNLVGPRSFLYNTESLEELVKVGLTNVKETLRQNEQLPDNETPEFLLNLWFKLLDTQTRQFHITKQNLRELVNGNGYFAKMLHELVFGPGLHLNYHKLFTFNEKIVQVPTPLGLSMLLHSKTPVLFSVKGHLNVDVEGERGYSRMPSQIKILSDIRPTVYTKTITTMGIMIPFTKTYAATGVNKQIIVSPVINGEVKLNLRNGQTDAPIVTLRYSPETKTSGNRLPFFHFHVKPFTVLQKYAENKPACEQPTYKLIETTRNVFETIKHCDFIQRVFGIPVALKIRSERLVHTLGNLFDEIETYGLWNFINTWQVPLSLKQRQYTVHVCHNGCETKEIQTTLALKWKQCPQVNTGIEHGFKLNTLWSYIFGWAKLPTQCKAYGTGMTYDRDVYQQNEEFEYNQQPRHLWNSMKNWAQSYLNYDNSDELINNYETEENTEYQPWGGYSRYNPFARFYGKHQKNGKFYRGQNRWENDRFENERWENQRFENERYENQRYDEELIGRQGIYQREEVEGKYLSGNAQIKKINLGQCTPTWRLALKMHTLGGNRRVVDLVLKNRRNLVQVKDDIEAELHLENIHGLHGQNVKVCLNGMIDYPIVPCEIHRSMLNGGRVMEPLITNLKFSWGQGSCHQQNQINIMTKAVHEELNEVAHKNQWYYQQCVEDLHKGLKYNQACKTLFNRLTTVNRFDIKINYQNVPIEVRNLTHKVDNFVKRVFYNHMSNDAVETGVNQPRFIGAKVLFNLHKPVFGIKLYKPHETTEFREIKYGKWMLLRRGLNVRKNIVRQFVDQITGLQYQRTCDIMNGRFVNTFNNLTLKHQMGGCLYVAAQDCTNQKLFKVLVSGPNFHKSGPSDNVYSEILLLNTKIELIPTGQESRFRVIVNGQEMTLNQLETIVVYKPNTRLPLAHITLAGGKLVLSCPTIGLKVFHLGNDVRVMTSYFWVGKVCGMCGNFDLDTQYEFTDKEECIYGTAHDFVKAYIVPEGQCQPTHTERRMCYVNNPIYYPQLTNIKYNKFESRIYDNEFQNTGIYKNKFQNTGIYDNEFQNTGIYKNEYLNNEYYGNEYENNKYENNKYFGGEYEKNTYPYTKDYEYQSETGVETGKCSHYRNKVIYPNTEEMISGNTEYEWDQEYTPIVSEELNGQTGKHQVCFSIEPIRKCKTGCTPVQKVIKSVPFHCLNKMDYLVEQLLSKIHSQPLDELTTKTVTFYRQVRVPTRCHATY